MNYRDYIIYDFESTSPVAANTQPTMLASIVVHGRTLEIKKGSEFSSYIMIETDQEECDRLGLDKMQAKAAEITGITEEFLIKEKAPSVKSVWANFVDYTKEYNFRGTDFTAPIGVGYNSNNFDSKIVERLCSKEPYNFGPKNDKFPNGTVFQPIYSLDLMQFMFAFFENDKAVNSISMDNLVRGHMGYSKGKAHDAMDDVIMTAELFCRVMKMLRGVCKGRKFTNIKWE